MSTDWNQQTDSVAPLLDMVLEHVPSPKIEEGNTQMLITSLDFSSFTGRIAIGRLQRGQLATNMKINLVQTCKVKYHFTNKLKREGDRRKEEIAD